MCGLTRLANQLTHAAVCAFLFTSVALVSLSAQTRPYNPVLTVDFSKSREVKSANGLLAGFSSSMPLDSKIEPLKPAFWRVISAEGTLARATTYAPTTQVVLSDYIGYPSTGWNGGQAPYADWAAYEDRLRAILANFVGRDVMIDVWNEPDNPQFWNGTQVQFYATYKHSYDIIREVLGPLVVVGGPSSSRPYDKVFLTAFLEYCRNMGCEVNSLSWHELDDSDGGLAAIPAHIIDARTSFVNNERYAALKMKRIDINEMIGPFYHNKPGPTLAYFDQIEKGGADSAARTCWSDSLGVSECFNDTLDGLLTSTSKQPRPNWWVHRYYAAGVSKRVEAVSSDFRIVGLGSGPASGESTAQVLIGYINSATVFSCLPAEVMLTLDLTGLEQLSFLNGSSLLRVKVERIPDLGEAELVNPMVIKDDVATISNGHAVVTITGITAAEAYRVVISSPIP